MKNIFNFKKAAKCEDRNFSSVFPSDIEWLDLKLTESMESHLDLHSIHTLHNVAQLRMEHLLYNQLYFWN